MPHTAHGTGTDTGACLGLWMARAEEMPCYSTAYVRAAWGEREREREEEGEGGRQQYNKFDFSYRLFSGMYAVGSVETTRFTTFLTFKSKAFGK